MRYLYVCNTASDSILKLDIVNFEEKKITLCDKCGRVGPHGICRVGMELIVANSYSNTISKIDILKDEEKGSFYVGSHCNDVDVYKSEAFITCGESNNLIIFDLVEERIVEELPCGNNPHSIAINQRGIIAVSNMDSDSVTLIDATNREFNKQVRVGPYPIKIKFSSDGQLLYVCESNLGSDNKGYVSVIAIKEMKVIQRIAVGKCPVDIYIDKGEGYVSNFNDGNISILDLKTAIEVNKIYIGGMPVGIIKRDDYMYVGDNLNNLLIRYSLLNDVKKVIAIGKEPTGMTLI
jgi:YVTN family beta-propeller protein